MSNETSFSLNVFSIKWKGNFYSCTYFNIFVEQGLRGGGEIGYDRGIITVQK